MTMNNLEAEIAKAKKQAADRIKKLKREALLEQKKIDARVIALLREQDPHTYAQLSASAIADLANARGTRAARARRGQPASPSVVGIDDVEASGALTQWGA